MVMIALRGIVMLATAKMTMAQAALGGVRASPLRLQFFAYLFIIFIIVLAVLKLRRLRVRFRTLTWLNNNSQNYVGKVGNGFAIFGKKLQNVPHFSKTHDMELRLPSTISMDSLLPRFQNVFVIAYFVLNAAFCIFTISWDQGYTSVCKRLGNRTGILVITNMIPLFIMGARNNPLINCLNLSFKSFNFLHKWQGRIVISEAIAHSAAWAAAGASKKEWSVAKAEIVGGGMKTYGFLALIFFAAISIQTTSFCRHAFYEMFKHLHIALSIFSIITIWYHLKLANLPQITILYGVVTIWCLEHVIRILKVVYRNVGRGGSTALVEALPGMACRVTITLARPWRFIAGQHAYLYIPNVGLWTSHPFSVAWYENVEKLDLSTEKPVFDCQDSIDTQKTIISFVIRARTGFTNELHKKAIAAPHQKFYTKCFAEGPYGGMHTMHSHDTVMLFAGGVGITHHVSRVRDLVVGYADGSIVTKKIVLVWAIQNLEHFEWVRPWMTSILAMDRWGNVLIVMLFISRLNSTEKITSPSAAIKMFPGRPNIERLIENEIENHVGTMGVSVCGSTAFSDDVQKAVRNHQNTGNITFVEESFSL